MDNNEVNVDNTTNDNQEIDYKALYEEKEAKVSELEWLIQKHKTKEKKKPETQAPNIDIDEIMEKKLAERDFFKNNPEMLEHKDAIQKLTSTGLVDYKQAKAAIIEKDPTIANRQVANQTNFTDSSWYSKTSYTQEELAEIGRKDQVKFRKIWADKQAGKITII